MRAAATGSSNASGVRSPIDSLERVKLSANWMAAAGHPGEDARLYDAVAAVGLELCPALDLAIPVGKDSLSMQAQWKDGDRDLKSVSPVSLVVTAFAPVPDVRGQLTPLLSRDDDTELWLIGLGAGRQDRGTCRGRAGRQGLLQEAPTRDRHHAIVNATAGVVA